MFIPDDGVDIYYTIDSANPSWRLIAANEPNDGVYTWTVPNTNTDRARIRIVVRDGNPASPDADVLDPGDFTIGLPGYSINVNGPSRLISIPVEFSNGDPADLFSAISSDLVIVRWYDGSDPADPWKSWSPTRDGDLPNLDNTMGFWMEVSTNTVLTVIGDDPVSTPIQLQAGWNLVGYPSLQAGYTVAQLKADTGATQVEGFNTGGPYYLRALSDADVLTAGLGYWVYVPANTLWTVVG